MRFLPGFLVKILARVPSGHLRSNVETGAWSDRISTFLSEIEQKIVPSCHKQANRPLRLQTSP
jgi:hypothetical protein